jgi:hypothetical protein
VRVAAQQRAIGELTDTERYTGVHRQRFDHNGRGRGLAGRDSVPKGEGSVAGRYARACAHPNNNGAARNVDDQGKYFEDYRDGLFFRDGGHMMVGTMTSPHDGEHDGSLQVDDGICLSTNQVRQNTPPSVVACGAAQHSTA